jgi:hypothetical protein
LLQTVRLLLLCCCCCCFLFSCAVAKVSQTAINVMSGKSYEQEFELEQQRMAVSPCQQQQQQLFRPWQLQQ